MFGKLFSNKSSSLSNQQDAIHVITETLENYRSETFPFGVMAVIEPPQITEQNGDILVALSLPFPCQEEIQLLELQLSEALTQTIKFSVNIDIKPVREHNIANIGNIIAIASGKGGVGKSTTTINLAHALRAEGARVGILDADIYGPSIPTMLGVKDQKPTSSDGKTMIPIQAHGISAMSIGFLVSDDEATVWRGPMASSAFNQLLNETAWPALDYLLIDMPPGTGDIQLTLAQKVPVAAAVIVTTPQNVALADATKGITMFDKVKVPVLGVIENMSYHLCENCGHQSYLFGQDGGADIAAERQTCLLGQLPLNAAIREDADSGNSTIIENSAGDIAKLYRRIARNMAAQLFLQLDERSPQTAEIAVETA